MVQKVSNMYFCDESDDAVLILGETEQEINNERHNYRKNKNLFQEQQVLCFCDNFHSLKKRVKLKT